MPRLQRRNRAAAVVVLPLLVGVLGAGCADQDDDPAVTKPGSDAAPAFRPGTLDLEFPLVEPVWSDGGVIHVGDSSFDLGIPEIEGFAVAPTGIFVRSPAADDGLSSALYFDGTDLQELPGRPFHIAVSESGAYAAWLEREGPEVEAEDGAADNHAAEVVVVDTATGEVLARSTEGLLDGARNPEEYSPDGHGFVGDTFYWNIEGVEEIVALDATDLSIEVTDEEAYDAAVAAASYDLEGRTERGEYGRLEATDAQGEAIDFGWPWVFAIGRVGDPLGDRILVRGQRGDPNDVRFGQAPTDGAVLDCGLERGDCTVIAEVADADLVHGNGPLF